MMSEARGGGGGVSALGGRDGQMAAGGQERGCALTRMM